MQLNDTVYWIDANLPPVAADWLIQAFDVTAKHIFSLGFLTTEDNEIFESAKNSAGHIIIITKDEDFIELVLKKKSPPKIIWITAGNLSNKQLKALLIDNFKAAVAKLQSSRELFIEIR